MTATTSPQPPILDPALVAHAQRVFDRLDDRLTLLDTEGNPDVDEPGAPELRVS
jgi:hypothetical protein